ncbi:MULTISPECIES: IclR family transcriptional regulator [Streptomyces]|nr:MULTISPECIES: helix-turn-helix domain-containing protein [Streptomyces]MBW8090336.1 helix-turn-helix domain-containing protein [Streptomyces hygroscopicus subsp. hygroscopicus]MCO8305194.1 helix-turn-helix domain-containing protein [Streptomyces sp. RKCA744]MDN3055979.1 helix-turn-helix domain-containing protein [Streptomyces sp. SRF1]
MLARGLCILHCFRPGESELPLSELARRADMPKATAHRIVTELVREGVLERGEKGLRLGVALFMLGARVPRQLRLRDLASPYAEQLHHRTRGSAFVFICDAFGSDAALVDTVRRAYGADDTRLGAEETWASAEAAKNVLRALGAGTVRHRQGRRTAEGETARARRQGFVAVRGAHTVGIAAPVLTVSNRAVGALAVAAPQDRIQVVTAASHLRAACAAISQALRRVPELVGQPAV